MKKRTYVVKYYGMIIHVFDIKKDARKMAKEKQAKLIIKTYDTYGNLIEVAEEDYSDKKKKNK